jgi:hypothetical protein
MPSHYLDSNEGEVVMSNRWARIIKQPARWALRQCERAILNSAGSFYDAPIFILGPPRSGTTVLYQLVVNCLEVSYFCNAAEAHPDFPVTITRILRSRTRRYETDYTSTYSKTQGACGPSEGRCIWGRWFLEDQRYVDEHHLSAATITDIQRTITAMSIVMEAPFVNKDPYHCVRVRALNAIFPRSLFIYVTRDPIAIAESLLQIRIERIQRGEIDLSTWVAVKPKEYPMLRTQGHIGQICGQVYYCHKNALKDLDAVAPRRWVEVVYEALCNQPDRELERIAAFLQENGVTVQRRRKPPVSLQRSRAPNIPQQEREAIRVGLTQLYGGSN